jgi:hypothetical protein
MHGNETKRVNARDETGPAWHLVFLSRRINCAFPLFSSSLINFLPSLASRNASLDRIYCLRVRACDTAQKQLAIFSNNIPFRKDEAKPTYGFFFFFFLRNVFFLFLLLNR